MSSLFLRLIEARCSKTGNMKEYQQRRATKSRGWLLRASRPPVRNGGGIFWNIPDDFALRVSEFFKNRIIRGRYCPDGSWFLNSCQ